MENSNLTKREYSYDLLRTIMCLFVVILHVSAIYVKTDFFSLVGEDNYLIASFWRVVTNLGVPTFVMLSGAFLIKDENGDFKYFYRKTRRRIIIPTIAFSILYVLMHYIEILFANILSINMEKVNLFSPLLSLLKGQPNVTMWYMFMIIPLYFITPIIVSVKRNVTRKSWHMLAIIMLIYSFIVDKTCTLSWILSFAKYLGYFLLGDVIREFGMELKKEQPKYLKGIGITCIVLSYLVLILYWYIFSYRTKILDNPGNVSLVIIIATMLQFFGFSVVQFNSHRQLVILISKYSMEIYLIHPIFLEIIMQYLCRIQKWLPSATGIPIYGLLVTILCVATYKMCESVFMKRIRGLKHYGE